MDKYKLSQLNLQFVKEYLKIDFDDDDKELELYIQASISYIKNNTKLDIEELDAMPDLTVVALQLIAHFYDNKSIRVTQNSNIDKMFTAILSQYWSII